MIFSSEHTALSKVTQLLRTNSLSLTDYISETCQRIEENDDKIFSILPEPNRKERLLQEAKLIEAKYPDPENRPELYGILVGIKDIINVDGFETHGGSALPAHLFKGKEANLVSKLKKAGALILGKTATTEFAYFEPAKTRNPHNVKHTPGGSSSGSAAAVACGFMPLSVGTQTIGSITRPASYCGIVGFKPSFGRIENDGVIPFSISVDHIGFFTQDISGINIAAKVLCKDWKNDTKLNNSKPVIGIVTGKYLQQASLEMINFLQNIIKVLEAKSYAVILVHGMDNIEEINNLHKRLNAAEFYAVHKNWATKYRNLYRKGTLALIDQGKDIQKQEIENGKAGREKFRMQLEKLGAQNNIDIWLSPSTTGEAPEGTATGSPIMNLPWTYAGLPTITFSAGKSKTGLPLGLQFAGKFMQDELLLQWVKSLDFLHQK